MKNQKVVIAHTISAVIGFIAYLILSNQATEMKKNWGYYISESERADVKLVSGFATLMLILSIIDCVIIVVYLARRDGDDHYNAGTSSSSSVINCPHCFNLISKSELKCPHCGRVPSAPVSGYTAQPTGSIPGPKTQQVKPSGKKCVFCGKAMEEDQLFCGSCGRRQD